MKAGVWLEMNLEQRDRCHGRERGVLVKGLTRQNPNSSAGGWEGFGNLIWIGVNRSGLRISALTFGQSARWIVIPRPSEM